MARVNTVLGPIPASDLGSTLIHEHLVVDVRRPAARGAEAPEDLESIVEPMLAHLKELRVAGIQTVVDCTPSDLGHNLPAYRAVAERTGLTVVCAVGTYRDAWLPDWVRAASVEQIADFYAEGIAGGAGFVKLGCDPDGPTPAEALCTTAAGRASRQTGALVACHVGVAAAANRLIDAFEAGGGDPERFVVVHIQNEPNAEAHLALARRGAWIEYDAIGAGPDDRTYLGWLRAAADAGLLGRVLVSQDACAYIVGEDGRVERQHRFDYLPRKFVPALRAAGFSGADVDRLLIENPARALGLPD